MTPFKGTVLEFIDRIDAGELRCPSIALGALDSIAGRHELARLHADLTIDGSTGGRIGTTVGLREANWDGPCLRCYFPGAPATSSLPNVTDLTGLSPAIAGNGDLIIDDALLEAASDVGRELLRPLKGKRVCSLPELLGLVPDADGYQPSAAFVAQLAAALVVGSLLMHQSGQGKGRFETREVEFDALFGWVEDAAQPRRASATCTCQRDHDLIATVKARRSTPPQSPPG